MRMFRLSVLSSPAVLLFAGVSPAPALEYPVGEPQLLNGMEIAAVYLQPIEMEPEGMMLPAAEADVHLEADIHATQDNANGFADGEWIPNLRIDYLLTRLDDGRQTGGAFMPMVASDGPHYGDNVKLMGPGKYRLRYTVTSQGAEAGAHFGRHVDKETGVAPWPQPFSVEYDFTFAGIGKKGGY